MADITAIILTLNEERHIERCIKSVKDICKDIVVVDSHSKDRTREIAERLGARVFINDWKNYATQFNFALSNCEIKSEWLWRIDADEYIEAELAENVVNTINNCPDNINGIYVRKRIDFIGKPLRHGGWYPSLHLKIWRRGHGECESKWMDEHIRLFDGETVTIEKGDQVDANLNDLTWWTNKHNSYATREMIDMLLTEYGLDDKANEVKPKFFGTQEQRKRWLKVKYARFPLFVRPAINFIYRYFFLLGFLDGKEGFIWHILQGYWYRTLVDAKISEIKKQFNFDKKQICDYIKKNYK